MLTNFWILLLAAGILPTAINGEKHSRSKRRVNYASRTQEITACEKDTIDITCHETHYINVVFALYGRENADTCPHPAMWSMRQKCGNRYQSIQTLREKCQWKRHCRVTADNRMFGDPCVGTLKYARIKFQCIGSRRVMGCEGNSVELICEGKTSIKISAAIYGRRDMFTCPDRDPSRVRNTNCGSEERSTATLATLCDNKKRCRFTINDKLFHAPCLNTRRYLEAIWDCVQR